MDTHTIVGRLHTLEDVWSSQLQNHREIYVYFPPSYEHNQERRYPVIYMHDGQNLFNEATSFSGEWQVDEAITELSRWGVEAIVVGIANSGEARLKECCPFPSTQQPDACGDQYLAFIVEDLKPFIDKNLRTLSDRQHTGMIGSSMGGLITLYAFFQHPEVFGFVGAMSPALWYADRAIFDCLSDATFIPGKLYLDIGTDEDPEALTDARQMRDLLIQKGYQPGEHMLYVEEERATHNEAAWAYRLQVALRYLLPRNSAT